MKTTARAPVPFRVPADKLAQIPCPNLRTLVKEGWLTPDKDGVVDVKQLDAALARLGVEGLPKTVLTKAAEGATHAVLAEQLGAQAGGKFNVFRLTGSNLDHAGDTRILRGGFNAQRLDWLLSFAKDGRLGMAEVSRAQKEARNDEPAGFTAKAIGVAELTALVKVYGTKDASGGKSISVDGVRNLYQNARFPDEWRAQLEAGGVAPNQTGLMRLLGGVVEMAFRQLGTPSGRARMGMDLALSRDPQLNQSSAMGLGAGICPAGPPVAMGKKQVDAAHQGN
jgi:hypothetical protein